MLVSTQWTKPCASGSSTISANSCVPAGAFAQSSSGETSAPSQVYWTGIGPPSGKSGLVSANVPPFADGGTGVGEADGAAVASSVGAELVDAPGVSEPTGDSVGCAAADA